MKWTNQIGCKGGGGGEARVRGQLAYDNPDVAIVLSILYHRKMNAGSISCPEEFKRKYIMFGGN